MVIFHSYVKLPESKSSLNVGWIPSRNPRVWFYNILEEPRNQTQIILIWSPQTHILNSNLCESNSDSQITSSFQKWIYIYIYIYISQCQSVKQSRAKALELFEQMSLAQVPANAPWPQATGYRVAGLNPQKGAKLLDGHWLHDLVGGLVHDYDNITGL